MEPPLVLLLPLYVGPVLVGFVEPHEVEGKTTHLKLATVERIAMRRLLDLFDKDDAIARQGREEFEASRAEHDGALDKLRASCQNCVGETYCDAHQLEAPMEEHRG